MFEMSLFPHNVPLPAPKTSAWLVGTSMHLLHFCVRVARVRATSESDLGWEDLYWERTQQSWFDWVGCHLYAKSYRDLIHILDRADNVPAVDRIHVEWRALVYANAHIQTPYANQSGPGVLTAHDVRAISKTGPVASDGRARAATDVEENVASSGVDLDYFLAWVGLCCAIPFGDLVCEAIHILAATWCTCRRDPAAGSVDAW